jgi:hypothetical protein
VANCTVYRSTEARISSSRWLCAPPRSALVMTYNSRFARIYSSLRRTLWQTHGLTDVKKIILSLPVERIHPASAEECGVVALGGSGFIGARVVNSSIAAGTRATNGDMRRGKRHPDLWRSCDARNADAVGDLLSGSAAVVNLAAEHRDDVRSLSISRRGSRPAGSSW